MDKQKAKELYSHIHATGIDIYANYHSIDFLEEIYVCKCGQQRRTFRSKLDAVNSILRCCIDSIEGHCVK